MKQGCDARSTQDGVLRGSSPPLASRVVIAILDLAFRSASILFWWTIFGAIFYQLRH